MPSRFQMIVGLVVALLQLVPNTAFSPRQREIRRASIQSAKPTSTSLFGLYSPGRSASRSGQDKSKRQYRVGQLVRNELGNILHSGIIKGDTDFIDAELRQRISIVSVDVAPDLRQARITVSVRASNKRDDNPVVDKRRAYSWLVQNTKPLRHTLAQKMSHMKSSPSLTFVQVDVGAAVDVMYLIDKVTEGYKRENIGEYGENDNSMPKGYVDGMDFDEEFDEEEWDKEDADFFDLDDEEDDNED